MKKIIFILFIPLFLFGCYSNPNEKLIGTWIRPNPQNSQIMQGFKLEKKGKADSFNLPDVKYNAWRISDGNLVLSGRSNSVGSTVLVSDFFIIQSVTDSMLIITDSNKNTIYYTRQK